jgi:hypothetical protein
MQILSQVNNTRQQEGLRIVIAGQEKMGKTTLTCQAPGALLVPLEIGYSGVTVAKTPMLQNFEQVEQLMQEITQSAQAGQFPYKTIVFDSATALERFIHGDILKMDPQYNPGNKKTVTMDSALGGYGKAYAYSNEKFGSFLASCDKLAVYGGINIVLTCHVFASKFMDPTAGEYDCWDLLLHSPKNQKTYGKREMITQWADIVGFLYEPMFVTQGDNLAKGMSANKGRVMGLSRTPSYVAGNRFGYEGEVPIPKVDGWNHFANAIYQSSGVNIFNV